MQGIIVTPSGDVWSVGVEKNQLVFFPKGDMRKAKLLCEGDSAEPCKSFKSPFHLGIDQQDRICVTNAASDHVHCGFRPRIRVRSRHSRPAIAAADSPSTARAIAGYRFGSGLRGLAKMVELGLVLKSGGNLDKKLTYTMFEQKGGKDGGSVTLLRPDGTEYPGSPFIGDGLPGPWAAVVDGDDNVWFSNFASAQSPIVELCGVRSENCPPGFKTGEQISPPGGYVGGGLQMQTDLAIDLLAMSG
jgi:hypothetical protein